MAVDAKELAERLRDRGVCQCGGEREGHSGEGPCKAGKCECDAYLGEPALMDCKDAYLLAEAVVLIAADPKAVVTEDLAKRGMDWLRRVAEAHAEEGGDDEQD